jgi:hypothetical protein
MKKILLSLSVILITVILFSCNTECKKHEGLIGKWERTVVDSVSTTYILEITENHEWKYFKGEELLEEGPFAVEENIFIMKHAEEEHSHEGDDHAHAHADDHKYEYSLNEEKTELSFTSEEKTSVFTKVK